MPLSARKARCCGPYAVKHGPNHKALAHSSPYVVFHSRCIRKSLVLHAPEADMGRPAISVRLRRLRREIASSVCLLRLFQSGDPTGVALGEIEGDDADNAKGAINQPPEEGDSPHGAADQGRRDDQDACDHAELDDPAGTGSVTWPCTGFVAAAGRRRIGGPIWPPLSGRCSP